MFQLDEDTWFPERIVRRATPRPAWHVHCKQLVSTMATTQANPGERAGLWTIVLAGGEGTRLGSLTRALYGEDLPKQFATLNGDRSMLQTTLQRTARFCPVERTVVVVAIEREGLARAQIG